MRPSIFVTCLLAFTLTGERSSAAIIAHDTFSDGGRSNGADPLDLAWYKSLSTMQVAVANDPFIGSGNALHVDVVDVNIPRVLGTFPLVAVGPNTGDKIRASFDLRLNDPIPQPVQSGDGNNLRFGLYNSNGNAVASDEWSESGHTGYRSSITTGYDPGGFGRINRDVGTDMGGGSNTLLSTTKVGTMPDLTDSTLTHSIFIEIERLTLNSLQITMGVDGFLTASAADSGPSLVEAFDEIVIRGGTAAALPVDFTLDNVLVESISAVPEPSTSALATIGMLALVLYGWRRRSR